jgi:hypothetical protein
MRRLRRFMAVRLSVPLFLLALLPPMLAGCAGFPPPAGLAGDTGAGEDAAAGGAAAIHRLGDAATELAGLLQGCSTPCLSSAQQDAIVTRAIAEHEMRRP